MASDEETLIEALNIALAEAEATRARLAAVEAERDGYRGYVGALEVALDDAMHRHNETCPILAERDALREEVSTLRQEVPPCPVCGFTGGFHDSHDGIRVPSHLTWKPGEIPVYLRKERRDLDAD